VEKAKIVSLGVEGGGATIYGWQVDGVWWFQQEGSSMYLNENDDEAWGSWSQPPVTDLAQALPDGWCRMTPSQMHPEFVAWFREQYEAERATLSADERTAQERFTHRHWQSYLARQNDTPP